MNEMTWLNAQADNACLVMPSLLSLFTKLIFLSVNMTKTRTTCKSGENSSNVAKSQKCPNKPIDLKTQKRKGKGFMT